MSTIKGVEIMKEYHVAIVGATGLVGQTFIKVLEEYHFPVKSIRMLASSRSAGKKIIFNHQEYVVEELNEHSFEGIDLALFSAGGEVSKKYAPIAVAAGARVIDNSSAWRQVEGIPLIVPEVNFADYKWNKLIANPNCSTIQSILPLKALEDAFGLSRVVYSTYQAVSGSGQKGKNDLIQTLNGEEGTFYPYNISQTCIPEIDVFMDNGYTKEEMKMVWETRKILHRPDLAVSATCIRVPVLNSHGVSIMCELKSDATLEAVKEALQAFEGIKVLDDGAHHVYPTSIVANGTDLVYVGRIRSDLSKPNSFLLYCTADNIRKGAAANAVQIASRLAQLDEI